MKALLIMAAVVIGLWVIDLILEKTGILGKKGKKKHARSNREHVDKLEPADVVDVDSKPRDSDDNK